MTNQINVDALRKQHTIGSITVNSGQVIAHALTYIADFGKATQMDYLDFWELGWRVAEALEEEN